MRLAPLAIATALLCAPASAAGPFDGTWRGAQENVKSNNSTNCDTATHDTTIRIVDSRFTRIWGPPTNRQTIDVEVKPDGTVFGATSAAPGGATSRVRTREYTFSGKITGDTMVAELGSSLCAVKLTLKRTRS